MARKERQPASKRIRMREARKSAYPLRLIEYVREASGKRLAETRRLWRHRICVGDLHMHTTRSDGTESVAEMRRMADLVGLDFIFVTDHGTIAQKNDCRKFPRTWHGQEPGSVYHHICLLDGKRKFTPKRRSLVEDLKKARAISPFVFIPHPAGWWPATVYAPEATQLLFEIGDEFAIEVMNGANRLMRANDRHDARARVLWDKLLCAGKRVTALAASDSHCPQGVGTCWTGVLSPRCAKPNIIRGLQAGHCFGSEAPLLSISCGSKVMGDTVKKTKGDSVVLAFEAADSYGLQEVKLIGRGRTVWACRPEGATTVRHRARFEFPGKRTYYRLECAAVDDRRAFTSPIYIEPRAR